MHAQILTSINVRNERAFCKTMMLKKKAFYESSNVLTLLNVYIIYI